MQQAAAGWTASWESHPLEDLSRPPHAVTRARRKYHYLSLPVFAIRSEPPTVRSKTALLCQGVLIHRLAPSSGNSSGEVLAEGVFNCQDTRSEKSEEAINLFGSHWKKSGELTKRTCEHFVNCAFPEQKPLKAKIISKLLAQLFSCRLKTGSEGGSVKPNALSNCIIRKSEHSQPTDLLSLRNELGQTL